MKKLLLSSAAICGLAMVATPATADVELEVGGYFKGYGVFIDQDTDSAATPGEVNGFDFIRDTEIHIGGETVLDNGLTIGAHFEIEADGDDSSGIDESYVYFSGNWGRVNFGAEDGAGYLLQVAAPSADTNIDGIRQFVNPTNYSAGALGAADAAILSSAILAGDNAGGVDYDMDPSGKSDKLTYLSPVMNGFQLGASYSPDTDAASSAGVGLDDASDTIGTTYELAARYEGVFNNVGVILGAGYSHGENEDDSAATDDDRTVWNAGVDLDFGPIGVGVAYREDNLAADGAAADDEETLVIGADYTTGPFKIGASYFDQSNSFATDGLDTMRYAGGVTYTYGPGATLRGSVGQVEHEDGGLSQDIESTYFTVGTQINF